MTTKKDNLMKLAKGKKEVTKAPAVKEEVKAPEKVLTPEEERNLKTKAKVEELLDGVKLTLEPEEKKEELLEVAENEDQPKSTDWLEEQVSKLSEENERLKSENVLAKGDYAKLFEAFQEQRNGVTLDTSNSDGQLQAKVVQLFDEIQAQYLSLGNNLIIYPVAFMNRLIRFFPFLEDHKRF